MSCHNLRLTFGEQFSVPVFRDVIKVQMSNEILKKKIAGMETVCCYHQLRGLNETSPGKHICLVSAKRIAICMCGRTENKNEDAVSKTCQREICAEICAKE